MMDQEELAERLEVVQCALTAELRRIHEQMERAHREAEKAHRDALNEARLMEAQAWKEMAAIRRTACPDNPTPTPMVVIFPPPPQHVQR
jgi:vacuolar-type H+-ATPase subunit D/Vma8